MSLSALSFFNSFGHGCMRNQPFVIVLTMTKKIRWHIQNYFPYYFLPGVLAGCLSYSTISSSETFLVALIQQWQTFCWMRYHNQFLPSSVYLKKIVKAAQDSSFEGRQFSFIFPFGKGECLLILHCADVLRE